MKASELIAELQKKISEHGDLSVYVVDDAADSEITDVYVFESGRPSFHFNERGKATISHRQ